MKRSFFFPIALFTVLLLSLGLTSCNSDDDPVEIEAIYSINVSSNYDGVPSQQYYDEVKSVQDAYDQYFTANREHKFSTMTSDLDNTNARVATLASTVNVALQQLTWHYTITAQIINQNSGATVYTATYRP